MFLIHTQSSRWRRSWIVWWTRRTSNMFRRFHPCRCAESIYMLIVFISFYPLCWWYLFMFMLGVVMRFKFVTLYIVLLVLCSWFCLFCLCLSLYIPGNAWGNTDKESPLATGSGKHVSGINPCVLLSHIVSSINRSCSMCSKWFPLSISRRWFDFQN